MNVHEHNERNLPQAKLDSEMNARFLLNELGKKTSMVTYIFITQ